MQNLLQKFIFSIKFTHFFSTKITDKIVLQVQYWKICPVFHR